MNKTETNESKRDSATKAFLAAVDDIQIAIADLAGWDACLALILCLSNECVDSEDESERQVRITQTLQVLGDTVSDLLTQDADVWSYWQNLSDAVKAKQQTRSHN